jgi:hypothetical protein
MTSSKEEKGVASTIRIMRENPDFVKGNPPKAGQPEGLGLSD